MLVLGVVLPTTRPTCTVESVPESQQMLLLDGTSKTELQLLRSTLVGSQGEAVPAGSDLS